MARWTRGDTSKASNSLDRRLSDVLKVKKSLESQFREEHVRTWTIMFCDVSRSLGNNPDEDFIHIINDYRQIVLATINRFDPPHVTAGDGPLVLACFETPEQAAVAAVTIQQTLSSWRGGKIDYQLFKPTIGLHTGECVVKEGELLQSHDCNLAKRIETEAGPCQITVSSTTVALLDYQLFPLMFVRTAHVKNIPEPQKIYQLDWDDTESFANIDETEIRIQYSTNQETDIDNDPIDEQFMGILLLDIAGSTKKFWNLGDREGNLLVNLYQDEVSTILKRYHADHIEPGEGDQIIACFESERMFDAIRSAIEVQRTLFRHNTHAKTKGQFKLQVSIGIHVGGVIFKEGRVFPTADVMFCKGIQDAAAANEIILSDHIATLARHSGDFALKEVGAIDLKGSLHPVVVHEVEWFPSSKRDNPLGFGSHRLR